MNPIEDGETMAGLPTYLIPDSDWHLKSWNFAFSKEDNAYMLVVPENKREDGSHQCLAMSPNHSFMTYLCQLQERNLWEREMENAPQEETPVTGKEQLATETGHDDAGETARIGQSPVDPRTLDL